MFVLFVNFFICVNLATRTHHFSNMLSSSVCKMFEADWIKRKIENTTELKIPISYRSLTPIRCVSGYVKLSGLDAVTCLQNTTFYGLDDVACQSETLKGERQFWIVV